MPEPQSWDELFRDLEALDWKLELQTPGGSLYIAQEYYEFIWGDQEWYFEAPPDGIVSDELLNFLWDSGDAPISWGGSMDLIQREPDAAYVGFYLEDSDENHTTFFAKITPGDAAPIYREFVSRQLRGEYTEEPMGRPPTTLINRRPDLIDQVTLRAAMRAQLNRASERFGGNVWVGLADDLNVANVAEDDSDFDESEKEALLDRYFEQSYSEEHE